MASPAPRNKWRYGLTALACLPPAALTFEKALALVDKGAVPTDKRNHNARTLADGYIEIPANVDLIEKGERVRVTLF